MSLKDCFRRRHLPAPYVLAPERIAGIPNTLPLHDMIRSAELGRVGSFGRLPRYENDLEPALGSRT